MIGNHFKTSLRNIIRYKGYALINILGLALGMTCAILIFLWVANELSYDRFHENDDHIYRVIKYYETEGSYTSYGPGILAEVLKNKYPDVQNAVRMFYWQNQPLRYEDNLYNLKIMCADPELFEIFTFPFISGDPTQACTYPNYIILTKATAAKLFKDESPLGKEVQFEMWGRWYNLIVTGVIENVPKNSHLQFDYVIPFEAVTWSGMDIDSWNIGGYRTYVMLNDNVHADLFNQKIAGLIREYLPESNISLILEPLKRIHLYNYEGGGQIVGIYILSAIGVLILLIACFNFMNLATARVSTRSTEIGLRKVAGSSRMQLVRQFLSESITFALLALILAIAFTEIMLPVARQITEKNLNLEYNPITIGGLLLISVFTGLIAGIYPAFYLSRLKPVMILKGARNASSGKPILRRFLVIIQFTISILLIIGGMVVYGQLEYIQNKDLGFNKEQVIAIPMKGSLFQKYDALKSEIMQNRNILSVTRANAGFADNSCTTNSADWEGKSEPQELLMGIHAVDFDYLKTFDLRMAEGRYFSREFNSDIEEGFIVNEAAVRAMGMEDPLGKQFSCAAPSEIKQGHIVGIIKDYNWQSLGHDIQPLILTIAPWWFNRIYIRLNPEDVFESMQFLGEKFRKIVPDCPFEYTFLDEEINRLYKSEILIGNIIKFATIFAIIIACLGLVGLASFTVSRRTTEIGIRKVLGASSLRIVTLLLQEFFKWILVANLIAIPLAYVIAHRWLQSFAYRIDLGWQIFALSSLMAFLAAAAAVGFQTLHAAMRNPANSLRQE
jgi:putative ABC transport system permease protein